MQNQFEHILLTTYNVPHTRYKIDEKWLRHRTEMFTKVSYPSIANQLCQNFKWIVFFGLDTPGWLREVVQEKFLKITPVFTSSVAPAVVQDFVRQHTSDSTEYVITSRCDNDDALAKDFIKKVQLQFRQQDREFINFNNGVQFYGGRAYKYSDESNPFVSLIERRSDCKTAMCIPHPQISKVAPVRCIDNFFPLWLQFIHGNNAANIASSVRPYRWPVLFRFGLTKKKLMDWAIS